MYGCVNFDRCSCIIIIVKRQNIFLTPKCSFLIPLCSSGCHSIPVLSFCSLPFPGYGWYYNQVAFYYSCCFYLSWELGVVWKRSWIPVAFGSWFSPGLSNSTSSLSPLLACWCHPYLDLIWKRMPIVSFKALRFFIQNINPVWNSEVKILYTGNGLDWWFYKVRFSEGKIPSHSRRN